MKSCSAIGRDLDALLRKGLTTAYLWDVYGYGADLPVAGIEAKVYGEAAQIAMAAMRLAQVRSRSGTNFRVAGAVLAELAEATKLPACPHCRGEGVVIKVSGKQKPCRYCGGSGARRWSLSARATMCGCRYPEFRDRLAGVYHVTLTSLVNHLAAARRGQQRAEANKSANSLFPAAA